jgi:hypothetical protein
MAAARKQSPSRPHRPEGARMFTLWVKDSERGEIQAAADADGRPLGPWMLRTCLRAIRVCACGHAHVAGVDGEDGGCETCDCPTWRPVRAGRTTP